MVTIRPYTISVPQEVLDDLRARLCHTRWPNEIPGSGWTRGTDLSFMKELVEYWIDEGGYAHVQMTRPQTLSFAIADSPVGMAA